MIDCSSSIIPYWTGTQQGDYQGTPPTNKTMNIQTVDLFRIENGIIVEHWDVVKSLDLLKRTGTTLSQMNKK
jgi:predicted SnoaL-like aldol condensation-catalyzing enzyme